MSLFSSSLSAAIYGLDGLTLTAQEKSFFREANPFGFILFKRNCETPEQLRRLTDSLRELMGRDILPILIDQEGGRVARLQAPHWRKPPAASCFADMANAGNLGCAKEATYWNARLIAAELLAMGITVNCAPLADIPVAGSHDIIGDRAYGADAEQVIFLAREMARGLLEGGVMPILKHIPGHGRATVDSHEDLPLVTASLAELEANDFLPFQALNDIPLGMTAHIIYQALDAENVATTSPLVMDYIRQNIGFDGLLMSDDLSMKALRGSYRQRAEASLQAGCDLVLHCNGKMDEMVAVAEGTALLSKNALRRAEKAWKSLPSSSPVTSMSIADLQQRFEQAMVSQVV
jgi:beta-N-acetylhexosaminidase